MNPAAGRASLDGTGTDPPVLEGKLRPPQVRGLPRSRLVEAFAGMPAHRLGMVIGPAGSGKTTLLAQFAMSTGVPVAWYRVETGDASESAFVAHLHRTIGSTWPATGERWASGDEMLVALDQHPAQPTLLVLDDLHTIAGSEAEAVLETLVQYGPPWLSILGGSRQALGFDISRLRVSGDLLELGPDHLRFRSWEVERLFHDFYNEPMPPEDLAALTRRTGGWAAGLQLFHLATAGKAPAQRRKVLASLGTRLKNVSEYLAHNVLDELPDDLRAFLVSTCVLGRLTGPFCDQLLETTGGDAMLAELERRQLFTTVGDDGSYRYHDVLRAHLEARLLAEQGAGEMRSRWGRAGSIMEAEGSFSDALVAYSRAEDWDSVHRVLTTRGDRVADDPGHWLEALPQALLDGDPWLLLATARRHVAEGRLEAALAAYRHAEGRAADSSLTAQCQAERLRVSSWVEPLGPAASHWTGLVRAALRRAPGEVMRTAVDTPGELGRVTEGVAAWLAGSSQRATDVLAEVASSASSDLVAVAAEVVSGFAAAERGEHDEAGAQRVIERAEHLGVPWLERAARVLWALSAGSAGQPELEAVRTACTRTGDRWGSALAGYYGGLAAIWLGHPDPDLLADAAAAFADLQAEVPQAWALAAAALAEALTGRPTATDRATEADELARAVTLPSARAVAALAAAIAEPERATEHRARSQTLDGDGPSLARHLAALLAAPREAAAPEPAAVAPPVRPAGGAEPARLTCFGHFSLVVGGRVVDERDVKPRVRTMLYLLAAKADTPVHRDTLIEALWPDADPRTGTHNLQVAISSLRRLLDPPGQEHTLLAREADTYRLALPPGSRSDVTELQDALGAARSAARRGDGAAEQAAFDAALDAYGGELLPEAGPVDWLVAERDRLRRDVAGAAEAVARHQADAGLHADAVRTCHRGLDADRFADALWRLLIESHEAAGELAAAAVARNQYADCLADLGIPTPDHATTAPRR